MLSAKKRPASTSVCLFILNKNIHCKITMNCKWLDFRSRLNYTSYQGHVSVRGPLTVDRECRERFPRHRLQRKPLVSDPGMHHGTCVTHASLTRGDRENVPGILSACATRNFTYLVKGPLVITLQNVIRHLPLAFSYLIETTFMDPILS